MNQNPTATETLLGGATCTAKKTDGTQETVTIRQLPVVLFPDYLAVIEDEPKQAELLCDKPGGWSDTLTRESLEQIVIEGERLNADFFQRWYQRRMDRQERLFPGITQRRLNALLPSPTSLPKPPSSAA